MFTWSDHVDFFVYYIPKYDNIYISYFPNKRYLYSYSCGKLKARYIGVL